MCMVRILSWNIRTFGDPPSPGPAMRELAQIMLESQADVICIQEVQIGRDTPPLIGAPVSKDILVELMILVKYLHAMDPLAEWALQLSPINNSDVAKSMRDAYVFIWKTRPSKSKTAHDTPVVAIDMLMNPVILRQPGSDHFPGRRPGMMVFSVTGKAGDRPIPLNVVSWHAATPCNTIAKGGKVSSGCAIIELATLPEIGGELSRVSGREYVLVPCNELPETDTIVLGDFNYSFAESGALTAYANLLKNYIPCVCNPDRIIPTTYSTDPLKPFVGSSSYDNIYSLPSNRDFESGIVFAKNSHVFNFIAEQAIALGDASGLKYFARDVAWYLIFIDKYKKQYSESGLSDHLPVWADFKVGGGNTANPRIQPTNGDNNNCLFHATYGAPGDWGLYTDAEAADHRTALATWVAARTSANLGPARNDLIAAMIAQFQNVPAALELLDPLLEVDTDPFLVEGFAELVATYAGTIRTGRMLFWHEAALLAFQTGRTINLYRFLDGTYQPLVLNPGQGETFNIYHFGQHYFRYNP